ncbi:unnamed protein product [Fusarium venenatum]|uniref:Uncharacterized protein n=1 Tax=Fusarium venenatum TaxID=56646 RepID=A0A2L2TVD6_9HYPO|nr:uncharacterized protein FVRRES_09834 [Fusarium venenatum]CEI69757.1 unnamed protein product [Fusarium venenatum]
MISAENMMRQQPLQSIETTGLHSINNDDTSSNLLEHAIIIYKRPHSTIPETPQKSTRKKRPLDLTPTGDEKDQCIQVQLPLKLERRAKKRRTESIRSDEDTQRARSMPGNIATGEEHISHGRPSPESPSRLLEVVVVTKLRPVPRGAPRTIERKGQYTIRKEVRIGDYKLPGPNPWPRASLPNSPDYQCRDGFNEKEASLGYPQPMAALKRTIMHKEAAREHGRPHLQRSPSLGVLNSV